MLDERDLKNYTDRQMRENLASLEAMTEIIGDGAPSNGARMIVVIRQELQRRAVLKGEKKKRKLQGWAKRQHLYGAYLKEVNSRYCKNNHPLTGKNIRWRKAPECKLGVTPVCRLCANLGDRERRAKKKREEKASG